MVVACCMNLPWVGSAGPCCVEPAAGKTTVQGISSPGFSASSGIAVLSIRPMNNRGSVSILLVASEMRNAALLPAYYRMLDLTAPEELKATLVSTRDVPEAVNCTFNDVVHHPHDEGSLYNLICPQRHAGAFLESQPRHLRIRIVTGAWQVETDFNTTATSTLPPPVDVAACVDVQHGAPMDKHEQEAWVAHARAAGIERMYTGDQLAYASSEQGLVKRGYFHPSFDLPPRYVTPPFRRVHGTTSWEAQRSNSDSWMTLCLHEHYRDKWILVAMSTDEVASFEDLERGGGKAHRVATASSRSHDLKSYLEAKALDFPDARQMCVRRAKADQHEKKKAAGSNETKEESLPPPKAKCFVQPNESTLHAEPHGFPMGNCSARMALACKYKGLEMKANDWNAFKQSKDAKNGSTAMFGGAMCWAHGAMCLKVKDEAYEKVKDWGVIEPECTRLCGFWGDGAPAPKVPDMVRGKVGTLPVFLPDPAVVLAHPRPGLKEAKESSWGEYVDCACDDGKKGDGPPAPKVESKNNSASSSSSSSGSGSSGGSGSSSGRRHGKGAGKGEVEGSSSGSGGGSGSSGTAVQQLGAGFGATTGTTPGSMGIQSMAIFPMKKKIITTGSSIFFRRERK